MEIETERLILFPLTSRQVRLWVDDVSALENELRCSYRAEPAEGVFGEIVRGQADKIAGDEAKYRLQTFWFIIRKSDNVVVGSACFKDVPNENGEVEIGYGLGKAFERSGYMTEAVRAMCGWALRQQGVLHVIAETEKDGPASHAVLRRCGFSLYDERDTLWWRVSMA